MRKRRCYALLCCLIAVLTACTASTGGSGTPDPNRPQTTAPPSPSSPTSSSPAAVAPLSFTDCSHLLNIPKSAFPTGRFDELTFGCGRLEVPLNYSEHGGSTISLEVIKIHSKKQTNHIGSLLTNPGGPGGSGIVAAVGLAAQVDSSVLDSFDLIGFDPRGVGLSSPVTCISDPMKDELLAADPDVRTPSGLALARSFYSQIAQACSTKYGSALAYFDTVDTAKDMDLIRQAVGDPKMNYLGFSYGTELGAVYAHLYPGNVRAEVLDGAVDPANDNDPVAATEEQLRGFESAFGQFAAWCAGSSPCRQFGNPTQVMLDLEQKANSTPIPSSDGRNATGGIVELAAAAALYDQSLWPTLADALLKATGGDASGLFKLTDQYADRDSDGHYDNLLDIFQVVSCNDQAQQTDPTDQQIEQAATRWSAQYPVFWRGMAAGLASCTNWQPNRTPIPPETAPTAQDILVVGNVNDPATPYAGAQHMTSELGNATLLTLDGQGHTSYLSSTCIAQKVNSYLISGTAPAPNTTCSR